MSTSVIVVIRHACDGGTTPTGKQITLNSNITINNHGNHTIVKDNAVTIPINWLGCLGLKQAEGLGTALKTLLEDTSKDYCPVSRIITEDTGTGHDDDGTSNPLHTISFYANNINTQQHVNFDIYEGSDAADTKVFNVPSLLQDGIGKFSTVICWEAKGMWRHAEKPKDPKDNGFREDTILGVLGKFGPEGEKISNYDLISDNSPCKGQTIYIFECNNTDHSLSLKIYNYDSSKPVADQFTVIDSSAQWPTNLCPKAEQHDCP